MTTLTLLFFGGAFFLTSCTSLRYVTQPAPNKPPRTDALLALDPGLEGPLSLAQWEDKVAPRLRTLLQETVYGPYPDPAPVSLRARRLIEAAAFDGQARLEEISLTIDHPARQFQVDLAIALPARRAVKGLFLIPNDCGNAYAMKDARFTRTSAYVMSYCNSQPGFGLWSTKMIFGRYVQWPPIEYLTQQGYGVITFHEGQIVPDKADEAQPILQDFTREDHRPGVITLWAWGMSRITDYLKTDTALSEAPIIVMGHSRRGKAALWLAAMDARIDMVIAHQSGTGGATLTRSDNGEPLADVVATYPHWFTPAYANYVGRETEIPVEQHHLLALIAPRPVLLGNAWRDVWSDPVGTFEAAQSASPAYALYGVQGLDQNQLRPFHPEHNLVFHIRPGTHGVVPEDWQAFIAFTNAHIDN
ncbi:glucuronyl esterase domain-containing protein [Woodsholea maritima]|uniref:glucuronyl esterase domain-containing protein n=1 Tax=Woodsholea maritima TaxID=240237 RepID=UPI0012EAA27D|nr:alpha/beta hydrolase [Woodsholea maritima]